jgi:hypothetical protein
VKNFIFCAKIDKTTTTTTTTTGATTTTTKPAEADGVEAEVLEMQPLLFPHRWTS